MNWVCSFVHLCGQLYSVRAKLMQALITDAEVMGDFMQDGASYLGPHRVFISRRADA